MKKTIFFLLIALVLGACCKEYPELVPGQNFIPDDILKAIENNGQVIHNGYTPPHLEGKYFLSPQVLVASNFDDQVSPGEIFSDVIVEFLEFDPKALTIKAKISEGGNSGVGYGGFISGQDNNFTVYLKVDAKDLKGHQLIRTEVYSGILEPGGIRNLQRSGFMVDDKGDPNDDYIENGQGRLAKDGDGFSEKL